MSLLLLLLMTMVPQENLEFPHPEFVLKCYPETVMPGDMLYFTIVAKNPHAKSIYITDSFILCTNDIQIRLKDSENQTQRLLFEGPALDFSRFLQPAEIKSGDSRVIAVAAINVLPLEDLKKPFWEKHLENLSSSGTKFSFCATLTPYLSVDEYGTDCDGGLTFTLETPLVMKPRQEKEMALIRKCYDETPKELFPTPYGRREPQRKIPSAKRLRLPNIIVKGEKVPQSQFALSDNHYPAYPNAPETWQGWKELEENLTPSTMRDEIRFTRILIQYCDTEDEGVLKELKDWFADMNEVQRSVLVKRTRNQSKMYEAVKEFDTALLEWEKEHLRNKGLIE